MSALPLGDNLRQGFGSIISYPGHKVAVEAKAFTALCHHKAADVLRIFIAGIHQGFRGERGAVPVSFHVCLFLITRHCYDVTGPDLFRVQQRPRSVSASAMMPEPLLPTDHENDSCSGEIKSLLLIQLLCHK